MTNHHIADLLFVSVIAWALFQMFPALFVRNAKPAAALPSVNLNQIPEEIEESSSEFNSVENSILQEFSFDDEIATSHEMVEISRKGKLYVSQFGSLPNDVVFKAKFRSLKLSTKPSVVTHFDSIRSFDLKSALATFKAQLKSTELI